MPHQENGFPLLSPLLPSVTSIDFFLMGSASSGPALPIQSLGSRCPRLSYEEAEKMKWRLALPISQLQILLLKTCNKAEIRDFPGGAVVKNPPAYAGDTGSSPGPGRSNMPRGN